MLKEPEIKRWTAKREVELTKQIMKEQTTIPEAARTYRGRIDPASGLPWSISRTIGDTK